MQTTKKTFETNITSFSHDGRGVASINGKVTFVSDALPGEKVLVKITRRNRHYNNAQAVEILQSSKDRIDPECIHAKNCGGCSMQHLTTKSQIKFRQQSVAEQLKKIGQTQPEAWLDPLTTETTGYRKKARLGVRYVNKKEKLLIGFREKQSNYLADINKCLVLDKRIGLKLNELSELISTLTTYRTIPQIEVSAGDAKCALIIRHTTDLPEQDKKKLQQFGKKYNFDIYLQESTPYKIKKIWPNDNKNRLSYLLPRYNLELFFHPADFTQINSTANQKLIHRAIELLAIKPTEVILDLFCGLGNFSLPIAKYAKHVIGVEGSLEMVKRARENSNLNNIKNTSFFTANLAETDPKTAWLQKKYDSILLDPPRSGAAEILPHLQQTTAKKIVYVSCNPATLARDAYILKNEMNFTLSATGIIDMFPHTGHVETINLFENKQI